MFMSNFEMGAGDSSDAAKKQIFLGAVPDEEVKMPQQQSFAPYDNSHSDLTIQQSYASEIFDTEMLVITPLLFEAIDNSYLSSYNPMQALPCGDGFVSLTTTDPSSSMDLHSGYY